MAAIGHIVGELHLTLPGYEPISLGEVRIALTASKTGPSRGGEATYQVAADIKAVADAVQQIFRVSEAASAAEIGEQS